MRLGFECAVPDPVLENLQKRKKEIIYANRAEWIRPVYKMISLGKVRGVEQVKHVPVLDAAGRFVMRSQLARVTATFLGADR